MTTTEIRELALQLPPEERALLARELLASLADSQEGCDQQWLAEAVSRADAYAAGRISAGDWEASLRRARARLKQGPTP